MSKVLITFIVLLFSSFLLVNPAIAKKRTGNYAATECPKIKSETACQTFRNKNGKYVCSRTYSRDRTNERGTNFFCEAATYRRSK